MTFRPLLLPARLALVALALCTLPATASDGPATPSPSLAASASAQDAPSRVIVKYRADSGFMRALASTGARAARPPQQAAALSQRLRHPLNDGRVLGNRTQGLHAWGLSSAQLVAQLALQPEVEWVVPDLRRNISALPNDPLLGGGQLLSTPSVGQWYLRAPDSTAVSAINATGAWDLTTGSPSVTIALLDTGVRLNHPDLAGKLHPGYDFVQNSVVANDGDGRDADANDPGDWTTAGECGAGIRASNSSWHGTQVAGLIGAATNNGLGMASVGRNVMVLPMRVLGRCGGFDSDIIAAARWAAGLSSDVGSGAPVVNAHPAKAINMSFGSDGACPNSYRDLIAELGAAGVSVVVAAGNENGLAVDTPANCPGAIAVAGVRHVGTKVGYSSLGPEVALAAPAGNCVNVGVGPCLYPLVTTINTGTTSPLADTFSDGSNASIGTSFSAPLVAGTIGLMLSVNPALTVAQVRSLLQASARIFPVTGGEAAASACHAPTAVDQLECYCTTSTCGAGLLDAARAVALALVQPLAVVAAPAPATSSGGGALGWGWLLGLAAAGLAHRMSRARRP